MYDKIITVSTLNSYIKKTLDNDFILSNSKIKGELSNVKIHSSGHIYFSLKDYSSKINCVMFKSNTYSLTFIPENGMNVVVSGRISVYEKEGVYQLYCNHIEVDGVGDLFVAFEKLKKQLEIEGLFDENRKKSLPWFPRRIGVITSNTGAAIRDIINVAKMRNPNVNILICPTLVQGIKAKDDIVKSIEKLNSIDDIDVIILARGGGSIEELWAFNEEIVARAIVKSKKPIVTGIGHETDFTISDFVSDKRASTPSQAAEIVVPTLSQIEEKIQVLKNNMYISMERRVNQEKRNIDLYEKKLELNSPKNFLVNQYNNIDKYKQILESKIKNMLEKEKSEISNKYNLLTAHNPLNVLNKGYSLIYDNKNNIIPDIGELKKVKEVRIQLKNGDSNFIIEEKGEF
ncbi:exodeoxyribonuclease VII large subunit [Clostridium senegalense]|uniref:exodeoxyribonuclease VII large subunit n=1 Tax=Clostridium senegalense TaxID=1465809 RepID=UPI000289A727|nr:exodeoxyribonuclease VII large subunit [Clostridium senegalense]